MVRLSIIIPGYNVEKYLRTCLDSVYQQGLKESEYEVILVNDGSTDQSVQIIECYRAKHSNIIFLSQENQGQSVARNVGIKNSSGRYLLFLDSDDFLFPGCLERLLILAEKNQLEVIKGEYQSISEEGILLDVSPRKKFRLPYKERIEDGLTFYETVFQGEYYIWIMLVERAFVLRENLSFKEGIFFEDVEWVPRLIQPLKKAMYVPHVFYGYRHRIDSTTGRMNEKKLMDLLSVLVALQKMKAENDEHIRFKRQISKQIAELVAFVFPCLVKEGIKGEGQAALRQLKDCGLGPLPFVGSIKDKCRIFVYNLGDVRAIAWEYYIRKWLKRELK